MVEIDEKELTSLRTDALRYRWLREAGCNVRDDDGPAEWYANATLDDAIDDAMRAELKP